MKGIVGMEVFAKERGITFIAKLLRNLGIYITKVSVLWGLALIKAIIQG